MLVWVMSVRICLNIQLSSEPVLGLNLFTFFPHIKSQSVRNRAYSVAGFMPALSHPSELSFLPNVFSWAIAKGTLFGGLSWGEGVAA